MVTPETLTDEQIDHEWLLGAKSGVHGDPDLMHLATVAKNVLGDFTSDEQSKSRARICDAINARAKDGQ